MMKIALTHGKVAIIDDADWPLVSQHKWSAIAANRDGRNIIHWYAVAAGPIYMHRLIMAPPRGVHVDHKDNDGLNNARSNLRIATPSQNSANSRHKLGRSGYRGVVQRTPNRWRAIINKQCEPGNVYLGLFPSAEEAARAYDRAAFDRYGEFATLNFPEELAA